MNKLLEKLNHRQIEESDNDFSFYTLKNSNMYLIYIHESTVKFHKSTLNIEQHPQVPKEMTINTKEPIINSIFEGIYFNNSIYFTDVFIYNNQIVDCDLKNRYTLLKKIFNTIQSNNFSLSKIFFNTTLEEIYTNVLPSLNFKPQYILMKKNMNQYLVKTEEEIEETTQKNEEIKHIKRELNETVQDGYYDIYATHMPDVYVADHHTFFSVIRVKTLKSSKFLKQEFAKYKKLSLYCTYDAKFKKLTY